VITGFLSLPEQARETISGLRAVPGWPAAPRIVSADELLPERALLGDASAVDHLIATVYLPLVADQALVTTAAAYLEQSPSLEATARTLVVHPNTVRYRLRRITEITGYSPTEARGAYALRLALTLGRLATL
jgi:DNA-binding PucR family transcriptional regulator